ncbi:MAG: hypothetical protein WC068_03775 [Caulobacter sp.]
MQALLEIVAVIVIWAASLAVSQLGIEVDLSRPPGREAPAARRPSPRPEAAAETPATSPCLDAEKARIRRV